MLHGKVARPYLLCLFEALPQKVPQVSEHEEEEPSAHHQDMVLQGRDGETEIQEDETFSDEMGDRGNLKLAHSPRQLQQAITSRPLG